MTSFMVGGLETAAKNLAVNILHVDGGWNVPLRTCPNALVKPHSPKMSSKGEVRRGVCLARVKRRPASTRQACSNLFFGSTPGVHLCTRLVQPPWTMVGWHPLGLKYTKRFGPFFLFALCCGVVSTVFLGQFHASD